MLERPRLKLLVERELRRSIKSHAHQLPGPISGPPLGCEIGFGMSLAQRRCKQHHCKCPAFSNIIERPRELSQN